MLPYSLDAYFGAIGRMNAELAIFVVIACLLGLFLLVLTWWPALADHKDPRDIDRRACLVLAAGWFAVGGAFYGTYLEPLFFAAPWIMWGFLLQALLFVGAAILHPLPARRDGAPVVLIGRLLMLYGLAIVPLLDALFGPGWPDVRFVGLAPAATVAFTTGWLLTRQPEWRSALLALVPACAGGLIGYSAVALEWPLDWPVAIAAVGTALYLAACPLHGAVRRTG